MSPGVTEIEARLAGAEDLYPMSDIELGMVYHSLEDPGLYHSQMLIPLRDSTFDLERLRQALRLLAGKHPILRTGLNPTGFEEPIQIVYRQVEPDLYCEDLGHLNQSAQEQRLRAFLAEDLASPFVFHQPPLWRVRVFSLDGADHCLAWVMHHAITDGWSTACLVTELREIYQRLAREPGFAPTPLACTYRDFVVQELVDKRDPESLAFWRREMADSPRLVLERKPYKALDTSPSGLHRHELGPGLLAELKLTAMRHELDLKSLCFTAYAWLLRMLAMDDEIVCGLVTNTRPLCQDGERLAGCFLNTIPVRLALPAGQTWREHARRVAAKLSLLKRYERVPLREIARAAGVRGEQGNPFFDVIFNFVNFHVLEGVPVQERTMRFHIEGHAATNTWLDFTVSTTLDSFSLEIIHRQDVFDVDDIKRLCGYYETILHRLAREPQIVARKLDLLPEAERRRLLIEFNATNHPHPETARTLAELFEEQVTRAPHAPAARFGDEVLTYAELNQRANALAKCLKDLGLGPDKVAALMLRRSLAMPVAIWGVLKAGGAYLPIDPDYPAARVDYMLADSGAAVLISSTDLAPQARGQGRPPLVLADDQALADASIDNPPPVNRPGDLAYIIYTSGSTGQPKGAMIEHRALINRVKWMQRRYPIGPGDVILQKTPYTFDVSVWEQIWWALEGAQVCFLVPGGEKDPQAIIDAVAATGVTVMHFVPSMLQAFLGFLAADPARRLSRLACLRQIFASGEALTPAQVNQCNRLLYDHHGVRLANLYGPTEAAIDVTWFDCESATDLDAVPIGRPIDNIHLHILDRASELQPPGIPGELCISGIGLARGYLNNPALTAEKFVANPLAEPGPGQAFARVYRTGDLARWRDDGNLEFLGRLDHQVKIRGLRIEPGEIENRLAEFPPVGQCLVTTVGAPSAPQLAAYIVPDPMIAPLALRLLALESDGGAAWRERMVLPNGLPVYMINRRETEFMFDEIFRRRCYHWPVLSLPDDAVVLDIGANLGLFSLWLGRLRPGARFLACEPIPELHAILALNCRLHGLDAQALNLGLGAADAVVEFHYHPQATILSSAHPDPEQELAAVRAFLGDEANRRDANHRAALDQVLAHRLHGHTVPCRVRPLSAVMAEAGLSRVDLLKIDVERAELEVLAGIAEADWPRIGQIVMEVHEQGDRLERVVGLIRSHGLWVSIRRDDGLAGAGLCNLFAQSPDWRASTSAADLSVTELERLARGPLETWPTPEAILREARSHLGATLPDYMVPSHFVPLSRFPLTGSGKIDRKSLPLPAGPSQGGMVGQGPRDALEHSLAQIFSRALARDDVAPSPESIDIHAGFFELGGDSLKCIAILSELGPIIGLEISMPELLANLNVAKLAALVRERRSAAVGPEADATTPGPSPSPGRHRLAHRGQLLRSQPRDREEGRL